MATIREDFFTALSKGAKWDVGVSINRTNPLPLDLYSVFQTEAKLDEYIAGKFSYPGQIVAVVGESATSIYYLDQNKVKTPVGVIPTGDNKTIAVTAEGAISLLGAAGAQNGTLPMIGEDGKLTWKTLEDIGAGDGNDNTTYEITALQKGEGESAETYGIKIKTLFNGQAIKDEEGNEIPEVLIPFNVYTKSEVDAKVETIESEIGVASKPESAEGADDAVAATGLYKLIEDEIARATVAESNLDTKIGKVATETEAATGVYAYVDNVVKTLVEGVDAEKVDSLNELINWVETHGDVADIKSDIKANADAIEVLNGDATVEGSVDNKIAALNIGDYAKSADVESTYATKEYVGTIPTDEKYADVTNVISYVNKKAEETLAAAQGGSSETAASVKQQLDNYKSENNTNVNKNTEDIATINDKLKDIEAGAQVNVIDSVVAKEGAKLTATTEGKTVTIDDSALVTLINAAQTKANDASGEAAAAQSTANEAKGNSEANAGEIETLKNTTIPGVKAIADKNAEDIAALVTKVAIEEGKVGTLETAVAGKADQSTVDTLSGKVGENTGKITTIEGSITAINTALEGKADKTALDGYYTKAQIGTLAKDGEGNDKTIVQMIEDAKAAAIAGATYDDTAVKADIKKNTDALTVLLGTKEGDNTKTVREIAADEINTLIGGANSTDTITNITTLIEYVNENGAEVTGIQTDIDDLQVIVSGIGGTDEPATVVALVEQEIAAIPLATLVKGEGDVITATKGLILPEAGKFEMADGKVTAVSTDILAQGENTLVLNGGSANA